MRPPIDGARGVMFEGALALPLVGSQMVSSGPTPADPRSILPDSSASFIAAPPEKRNKI